ncbi:hypothetical protein LXL04_032447 [Taraxacum kok-saghyz]
MAMMMMRIVDSTSTPLSRIFPPSILNRSNLFTTHLKSSRDLYKKIVNFAGIRFGSVTRVPYRSNRGFRSGIVATPGSDAVQKSEDEWRAVLSPEQFRILREKGTEYPGTGQYNKFYEEGSLFFLQRAWVADEVEGGFGVGMLWWVGGGCRLEEGGVAGDGGNLIDATSLRVALTETMMKRRSEGNRFLYTDSCIRALNVKFPRHMSICPGVALTISSQCTHQEFN